MLPARTTPGRGAKRVSMHNRPMEWVIVLAVGLVAGTVGGIVGFGTSIMLLPPLVIFFGPH